MDAGRKVEEKCNPTRPFGAEHERVHTDENGEKLVHIGDTSFVFSSLEIALIVLDDKSVVTGISLSSQAIFTPKLLAFKPLSFVLFLLSRHFFFLLYLNSFVFNSTSAQ